jgi:hypothetical protein
MDKRSLFSLRLQEFSGRLAVSFVAPFYFSIARLLNYRVRDLREVRRQCAEEFSAHKGPWIICANHLTMIDSFLLIYAAFSLGGHLTQFRKLPWNLPERSNFQSNIFLAVLCYLSKCIPVDRGGSREKMKKALDKCIYLLRSGHTVMIFPEGGRSRTGRVDQENFSYGVGRFVKDVENCRIMCIYLRGDQQRRYGVIPAWGDKFYAQMEVFTPTPLEGTGLRVQREYAAQIINRLAQMEEKYFDTRRKRSRGFKISGQREKESGFALPGENPYRS